MSFIGKSSSKWTSATEEVMSDDCNGNASNNSAYTTENQTPSSQFGDKTVIKFENLAAIKEEDGKDDERKRGR